MTRTKEPQYEPALELRDREGFTRLGLTCNWMWDFDPKRMTFVFARYKFVARMLEGRESALEVGCADGFVSRIVRQAVGKLTAVDFDPNFIEDAKANSNPRWAIDFRHHNMLDGPVEGTFDAAYSIDVLEHIAPADEPVFMRNLCAPLAPHAVAVIGMPSLQSQTHASEANKIAHINCKDGNQFRRDMGRYFHNVFVFSMNDEVIHTGFYPMAQYLFALCCDPKREAS